MTGIVIRYKGKAISRRDVKANATTSYYMLGDTVLGTMRGPLLEPNVIHVPVRYRADGNNDAFFNKDTINDRYVIGLITGAFVRARQLLDEGFDIVIPSNIGIAGLAKLQDRSPEILDFINKQIRELEEGA